MVRLDWILLNLSTKSYFSKSVLTISKIIFFFVIIRIYFSVLVDALRPSASIDVIQLVRTGVMSYVIDCLTLKTVELREGAIKCLTLIGEHGESFRWKSGNLMKQFLLILRKYIGQNEKVCVFPKLIRSRKIRPFFGL